MEQISAGFSPNDDVKVLFIKYKDAFGYLFKDGNKYLCDQDYERLYRILAGVAEWDCAELESGTYIYERTIRNLRLPAGAQRVKFFFRAFGIYLREATYRYAHDFTQDGAIWANLTEGILKDLNDAFKKNERNQHHVRESNRGNTFWSNHGRCIREELTSGGDGSLLRVIFRNFDDDFCKILEDNQGGNDHVYVKHLIKIAGCPLNFNPVSDYRELRNRRSRNALEDYVNELPRSTLEYAPKLRENLTSRICDFFDFLGDLRTTDLQVARHELAMWSGFACNNHYFQNWLQEELRQNQMFGILRSESARSQRQNFLNTTFLVSYNMLNRKVSVSCPDSGYICHILRKSGLEPRSSYVVFADPAFHEESVLFEIGPYGHINARQTLGEDRFNRIIFKLFSCSEIQIRERRTDNELDARCVVIPNPWIQKVSMFNHIGRPTNSIERGYESFLILPPDENVVGPDGIELECALVQDAVGGMNVYRIMTNESTEKLVITTNLRTLCYDVQDPHYLHLYQDKKDRKDVFVHQRPHFKFGIGNVQFSHLGNFRYQDIAMPAGCGMDYSNDTCRLTISNNTNEIRLIQETVVDGKILPKTVILPSGWNFWMAKENNHFYAYLKTAMGAVLPHQYWNPLGDNIYQYIVDDYDEWKNKGYPIYFLSNDDVHFDAWCPYFNKDTIHNNWRNSQFFLGANPFDDVIPKGGKYYFSWCERGNQFEAEVDYDDKSLRQCLKSFGLWGNLPEITFGWSYEGTKFAEVFAASENYHEPERPSNVYGMDDSGRATWLSHLLVTHPNSVIEKFKNRFSSELRNDIEKKICCGWFRDDENNDGLVQMLQSQYFVIDVLKFRKDLCDITDANRCQWIQEWTNLTDERHAELVSFLQEQLLNNNIACDNLHSNVFQWSFVSEWDIGRYIDYRCKEKVVEKIDDFLEFWNGICEGGLRDVPVKQYLLRNKSFAECSQSNFNLYAQSLKKWLMPYLDISCKEIPADFFEEDAQGIPKIKGDQIHIDDIARERIEFFKRLKSENEHFEPHCLSDSDLIDNLMPPAELFGDMIDNGLDYMAAKGNLWLLLIKNMWIANGRMDLCERIDQECEQSEFQEQLQHALRSEPQRSFHGLTIKDEIVVLANHLRGCLELIFKKEANGWKLIRKTDALLGEMKLPPEVFVYAPKDNYPAFINRLVRQLIRELDSE